MAGYAFLGGFLAVAIGIFILVRVVRKKVRRFSREYFGTDQLTKVLRELETQEESKPRSLSGCDSIVLPKILRDFPDFDVTLMKTYAKEYLKKKFGSKPEFTVYNVVIVRYLPTGLSKTIILQAAVSWRENGRKQQKRFTLHYTYQADTVADSVAANCPNCGGAIGYGEVECPYCGSRVANVMGNTWEFTRIDES